jgi:predicted DsbA family dithiol-disulfide isomerase
MKLDVWTDIICPWCWLGKRRLEKALELFLHRDQLEVTWRSFELDASAPRGYEGSLDDMLAKKYGMSPSRAKAVHDHLTALGAKDGIEYRFDIAKPGNTFDAHRLVHFAKSLGAQHAMQSALMRGYFHDGVAVGNRDVLATLAASTLGVKVDEASALLASDRFSDDVRADEQIASELGIHGVPCVVALDAGLAVSGAQEVDTFLGMIEDAWEQRAS